MASTNEIRETFLSFFKDQEHQHVSSGPLVPQNDPTLMFTNAGMVQFKNLFTGVETRDYNRAVTSQKCVRAGGKHNDLENVGYTARHHTFFEMLGNFSFGDYFKEQAIELAWTLMTSVYGLPADKLLVTVFAEDEEAGILWRKISGLPESKIIKIATSDNFWAMGATGPCGPCSEIFFDHGPDVPGGPPGSADEDGDRFIEIWNLVFMQYEQVSADERIDLPRPSIDTGMGLERLAAILQGKHDNYDTDTFVNLIKTSAELSGTDPNGPDKTSHRVITDHLRSCSFLMADGVMPSNEGRGYVLRRIMRRAMRHAHKIGCDEPLMHRLVPSLTAEMGVAFPELIRAEAMIKETFLGEEIRFRKTLDRGLKLLENEVGDLAQGSSLSGETAFKLYDTYGFPLDLTQDILRGQGHGVDQVGFDAAMESQRAAARAAWSGSGDAATEAIWFDLHDDLGASEFVGYEMEKAEGEILAIVADGARVEAIGSEAGSSAADQIAVIVNQTPFYGESGGQQGDHGLIEGPDGRFDVVATQKRHGDLFIHLGRPVKGRLAVGDSVALVVDPQRRAQLRGNHSATHILHKALQEVLGDHVAQKGSLVAADRLRLDVSHGHAITSDELEIVEKKVNDQIRDNREIRTRLMGTDEAIAAGAMALFGENYGDEVRVLSIGTATSGESGAPANSEGAAYYSTELCGGTHARRAGDIGLFRIISEGAVAAGIRRVEAMTGEAARAHMADQVRVLVDVADTLKVSSGDLPARISALTEDRRRLDRELSEARRQLATGGGSDGGASDVKEVAGIKFAARKLAGVPAKELKAVADGIKQQIGSGVVALVCTDDGKASLVVGVTKDLTEKFDAKILVQAGVEALGGKGGGGRPDMAQGGGPNAEAADAALAAVEQALAD